MPNAATRVDFYVLQSTDLTGRLRFACRLMEKAYRLSHRIYAHTDNPSDAERLDEMLWTFRAGSFVPHEVVRSGSEVSAPVSIGSSIESQCDGDLLVNLGEPFPEFFGSFGRIAEIVDGSAACKQAGRERFRRYRDNGCELQTHQVG